MSNLRVVGGGGVVVVDRMKSIVNVFVVGGAVVVDEVPIKSTVNFLVVDGGGGGGVGQQSRSCISTIQSCLLLDLKPG